MKFFVLIYLEDSDNGCSAEAVPFLDETQAAASMREAYEKTLKSTEFNVTEQTDDHYCRECTKEAVIVDGLDRYSWRIEEHELDVQVAVEVEGGLVQGIYANTDVYPDVYDLDVSSYPEEGEEDEADQNRAELGELKNQPGWRSVW